MSAIGPTIVFLGRRAGALRAARRLGLSAVVFVDAGADPPVGTTTVDFGDTDGQVEAVSRQLGDGARPVAVLGVTEGSVSAASRIRRHLDIDPNTPDTGIACTDKVVMKRAVRAAGIPCADWVEGADGLTGRHVRERLGLPLYIKKRVGSGRRGALLVESEADLPAHVGPALLAENLIAGREMSVESIVADGDPVFVNFTEYLDPLWANVLPARLAPLLARRVMALNHAALAALGIRRGFTHLELFTRRDEVVFGEIALRPPGGYIMDLIERAYGFDPWEAWIRIEAGMPVRIPSRPSTFAGVRLLHPGRGKVVEVAGIDEARAVPGIVGVHVRVGTGDRLGPRVGSGQEAAHVTATGNDRATVVDALERAREALRIRVEPEA